MNNDDLIYLITNIGFPALVTMYLLVRIEGKLEKLSTSISDLSKCLTNFID